MTEAHVSGNSSTDSSLKLLPATLAIFLVSVCGLFLEMLLIRWIGTEVRIFAYLQNSILIACFLGLGLGSLTSRKPVVLRQTLIPLTFLLVCLAIPITRKWMGLTSEFLGVLQDFVFWGGVVSPNVQTTILALALGLGITFVILRLTVDMFVPIGRLLGRLIDAHPNTIWAYSVNVAGSLAGIWLFVLLSRMYQPPVVWIAIFAALFVPLIYATSRERGLSLLLLVCSTGCAALAGWTPGAREVVWSPYQKLGIEEESGRPPGSSYQVTVNNVFFQSMVDPGQRRLDEEPAPFPELNDLTQYDIPLLLHPHPRRYLVVGAGTGNDAAAGVRHGVPEVTAVEIDAAIIDLGRRYHPEHPYDSSSVHVVNDDARSFFSRTHEEYDVIVFGALDSHTTTAMTNARLDHYVYTKESIARARALLAEGGVLVVSFAAQRPFIVDRMASVLRDEFQQEPLIFGMPHTSHWSGLVFVTGNLEIARKQIAKNAQLRGLIEKMQRTYPVSLSRTTQVATDDWPYIYLQEPRIPMLYYLLAGLMVLVAARSYSGWNASGTFSRWQRSHWHFFFLGAGFLLLEVQNISKASVVLGNTWQVNAVIVSGVLLMILLANLLQHLFPSAPIRLVYVALIASCLALYFIDLARFAFLPYTIKAILVGGLTTLPMVFSGIIFVRSLTAVRGKDEALGANLLGALIGGLLQTLTFVTGIRALLLVVALFYLCSLVTRPKDVEALRSPETAKA
jgi:predicted membrane-bound spermidine synthase